MLSSLCKASDVFFVGVPQLEMAGLHEILCSLLWIFGNKYIFSKLVTFIWFIVKYLSFACVIFPFFKLIKI